jgi:hypothetical protein
MGKRLETHGNDVAMLRQELAAGDFSSAPPSVSATSGVECSSPSTASIR